MAQDLGGRLGDARDNLMEWYEQLNARLADAESELRRLNLSQPVWVFIGEETLWESPDGSHDRDIEFSLGYAKLNGKWGLYLSYCETGDPDSFEAKPVLDCSLEQREMALAGLPTLLEKIVQQAEADAERIESTLGAAAEALSTFKSTATESESSEDM